MCRGQVRNSCLVMNLPAKSPSSLLSPHLEWFSEWQCVCSLFHCSLNSYQDCEEVVREFDGKTTTGLGTSGMPIQVRAEVSFYADIPKSMFTGVWESLYAEKQRLLAQHSDIAIRLEPPLPSNGQQASLTIAPKPGVTVSQAKVRCGMAFFDEFNKSQLVASGCIC